ncbi:protein NATD1-like [Antennarius striatus]|uniref:protein NATD1-like n=1 Tax=Antennarius striatus TaxID=241820 RepID=UPI0035AE86C0
MGLELLSRVAAVTLRVQAHRTAVGSSSSGRSFGSVVQHDRRNRLFTVCAASGAGCSDRAVLHYRFTAPQEVELMSTFVPEALRGRGVAALLSQAALEFVVEENLKAHVSCWYIQKYLEENPLQRYQDRIFP